MYWLDLAALSAARFTQPSRAIRIVDWRRFMMCFFYSYRNCFASRDFGSCALSDMM
jgi:hypothetical protein